MNTIEDIFEAFLVSTSVTTDTRNIQKGTMFFALKGDRFDGNIFAEEALSKGARYVVIDNPDLVDSSDGVFIVDNVLLTLQKLARKYRDTFDFPVVALTGSNGKTTTKELAWAVMSTIKATFATFGNFNNHIGVPLTILSTPPNSEFLIVEMGANHQGEIEFLCSIADPDFVMITNIGLAHLEGFGGLEGIKKGKSEIYRYAAKYKKTIFINADDEDLVALLPKNDNVKIEFYNSSSLLISDGNSRETISFVYKGLIFKTQVYGTYNLPNIAFAIELGQFFGGNLDDIRKAICEYVSQNNRSQVKRIGNNEVILDAYNANPTSMLASLKSFDVYPSEKKVAILGDMLELGEYADKEHQKIINYVSSLGIETVIFVGPIFKSLGTSANFFGNVSDARIYFKSLNIQYHSILLKGSRGVAVEKILE